MPAVSWIRFIMSTAASGATAATTRYAFKKHVQEIINASGKDDSQDQMGPIANSMIPIMQ